MSDNMIHVAAGIIRDGFGRILTAKRGDTKHNAHLWEFPGGKLEWGEDAAAALKRELMEELALDVSGICECHVETEGSICLHFLTGRAENEPILMEHEEIRFVNVKDMEQMDFAPADRRMADILAMQQHGIRYFLWDYDGTVMDTYPMNVEALRQECAARGVEIEPERIYRLMMDTQRHSMEVIAGENHWDTEELFLSFKDRFVRNYRTPAPVPGIPDSLRKICLMGGENFLVTHNSTDAVDALKETGLSQYFTGYVTGNMGLKRKPDPAMVNYVLEKHNIPKEKAMMIGDRPLDVKSGASAGIFTCLLDRSGMFRSEKCDWRVDNAGVIPECILEY